MAFVSGILTRDSFGLCGIFGFCALFVFLGIGFLSTEREIHVEHSEQTVRHRRFFPTAAPALAITRQIKYNPFVNRRANPMNRTRKDKGKCQVCFFNNLDHGHDQGYLYMAKLVAISRKGLRSLGLDGGVLLGIGQLSGSNLLTLVVSGTLGLSSLLQSSNNILVLPANLVA